ncbi:hypothetical protein ACCC88_09860 [Sphingomonas sp. Sphisp140]|uniref:hypothetical protein n=1 Tax=unclassified Sphingomonas TaxID=196159 RepID=UPI0039AFBE7C
MSSRQNQPNVSIEQGIQTTRKKRGVEPKPIIEFPEPNSTEWDDPADFSEALSLHMDRHGDTIWHLHRAVEQPGESFNRTTIREWRAGRKFPRSALSYLILGRIERRYRLPSDYFRSKLPHPARAPTGHAQSVGIDRAERRRLAWHLPDDFDQRPMREREEILEWVRRVIISGSTEYRRFQAQAVKLRYAIRFPELTGRRPAPVLTTADEDDDIEDCQDRDDVEYELAVGTVDAPPALAREVEALIRFKTATLTTIGYQRSGVWNDETALQKVEHLGLLFGALAASPRGAVEGRGVPLTSLGMGILVFPAVWDWYVQWRERRRGFYTSWEVNMLQLGLALTRRGSGWLRQHPEVGKRLRPIRGLVSQAELDEATTNWDEACDRFQTFALARSKEIERVARVHRDPFEPILTVLEARSPVAEYRRITEEVLRLMPDKRHYPRAAAETVRAFLMLRLGLHLGLRQKNLRQLLVCPRNRLPTPERQLETRKVGELRWSERDAGWEVLIPAVAFKNSTSSFFGNRPFRLVLPNLGGLYEHIAAYISEHRPTLLRGAPDPGTFFVKTVKTTSQNAAYDQNTFYEAWRLVIQRYGIFNPYTGRGAIAGLLPHGPHNIRDVLATHILKQTGSYEQASYAIQDTPDMVAKHYGRFLPQDKAELAAKILNQVWEAA